MAMSFSFSNTIDHFHYLGNETPHNPTARLCQKSTANAVLGHGMRKLPKPLNIRRIGVWALRNGSRREGDFSREIGIDRSQEEEQEEKPYRILSNGRKVYLDELDILTVLEPPKYLVPLNKATFNLAAYLWKKIGDIPEERRHRLFYLLKPKHISRFWEIAGMRYKDTSTNTNNDAAKLLHMESKSLLPEYWSGKINEVPWPIGWMSRFKKAFFHGNDGCIYGRVLPGGFFVRSIANGFSPLYFVVRNANEVLATEEPCDLTFEFGDGQLQLLDLPQSFPRPAKHPWPFNDQLVVYIRSAGPNVLVGQAWQEGRELEQVPQKFLGELVMIKDCANTK